MLKHLQLAQKPQAVNMSTFRGPNVVVVVAAVIGFRLLVASPHLICLCTNLSSSPQKQSTQDVPLQLQNSVQNTLIQPPQTLSNKQQQTITTTSHLQTDTFEHVPLAVANATFASLQELKKGEEHKQNLQHLKPTILLRRPLRLAVAPTLASVPTTDPKTADGSSAHSAALVVSHQVPTAPSASSWTPIVSRRDDDSAVEWTALQMQRALAALSQMHTQIYEPSKHLVYNQNPNHIQPHRHRLRQDLPAAQLMLDGGRQQQQLASDLQEHPLTVDVELAEAPLSPMSSSSSAQKLHLENQLPESSIVPVQLLDETQLPFVSFLEQALQQHFNKSALNETYHQQKPQQSNHHLLTTQPPPPQQHNPLQDPATLINLINAQQQRQHQQKQLFGYNAVPPSPVGLATQPTSAKYYYSSPRRRPSRALGGGGSAPIATRKRTSQKQQLHMAGDYPPPSHQFDLAPAETFVKYKYPLPQEEDEEGGETEVNIRLFNNFSRMNSLARSSVTAVLSLSLAFLILSNLSLAATIIVYAFSSMRAQQQTVGANHSNGSSSHTQRLTTHFTSTTRQPVVDINGERRSRAATDWKDNRRHLENSNDRTIPVDARIESFQDKWLQYEEKAGLKLKLN